MGVAFSLIILLTYGLRRLLQGLEFLTPLQVEELVLLIVVLPSTLIFLWYSGGFYSTKILILAPSLITALSLGPWAGLLMAAFTGSFVFYIDLLHHSPLPKDLFQTDLFLILVNFLLTWFTGGVMAVEQSTQKVLARLAEEDQVTGLYNHRYFQENLSLRLKDNLDAPLSLALLGIDQFKYINASYGFEVGDRVLEEMGRFFEKAIRPPCG
ncbi:MAG TPA: diguanylate cyclase [Moorella mulderi]|nr:diguanylate cyclase [Moorella mulderi]